MNTHRIGVNALHTFTRSLVSPPSNDVGLSFTFSEMAKKRGPRPAAPRSPVSRRLILPVRGSMVTTTVSSAQRCTWRACEPPTWSQLCVQCKKIGCLPSSTTSTAPGNENTGLLRSRSANSRKMARVCVLITDRISCSKSRFCASCPRISEITLKRLRPRRTYHCELACGNSAFCCERYP